MQTKTTLGFSLLEMLITLVIATITVLATLLLFERANQGAISQGRIIEMNGSLRIVSNHLTQAVSMAGFGLLHAPDYAIRTYNKLGEDFPDQPAFSGNPFFNASANLFEVKALANSDAILTIRSEPDCEFLQIDPNQSDFSSNPYTLVACLPQSRCTYASLPVGTTVPALATRNGQGRTLLLLRDGDDSDAQLTQNLSLRVVDDPLPKIGSVPGCPGAGIALQFQAKVDGLQINNNPIQFAPLPNALTGRLIQSNFFYVGVDHRLYDIPLTYFSEAGEKQKDRVIAEDVDNLQMRYYVVNDLDLSSPRNGEVSELYDDTAGDHDGIPQTEAIRMVEFAVVVRSQRPDVDFKNIGSPLQVFDNTPTGGSKDSFRRRILQRQVLARNLQYFGYYQTSTLYP